MRTVGQHKHKLTFTAQSTVGIVGIGAIWEREWSDWSHLAEGMVGTEATRVREWLD